MVNKGAMTKQDIPISQILVQQGDPIALLWHEANTAIKEKGAKRFDEVTELIDLPSNMTASTAEKVIRRALLVNRHLWARR